MKLALKLPWGPGSMPQNITGNPVTNPQLIDPNAIDPNTGTNIPAVTLGSVINQFGEVAIYIGIFLMFFWMAWGVFDYLRAEGNKESLAKARKKIQWAIGGFVILLLAFFLSDFVYSFLLGPYGSWTQPLQKITAPP